MRARLAAHRWPVTAAVAAVAAVVGWLTRLSDVRLPLVTDPVPARSLLGVVVAVVALGPLHSTFPELERGLVRETRSRLARVCGGPLLAAAAAAPTWWQAGREHRAYAVLFLLLVGVGVAAVVAIGELAWTVPLALGVLAVLLDAGPQRRVSRLLEAVPVTSALLLTLTAGALFVRLGSRRG